MSQAFSSAVMKGADTIKSQAAGEKVVSLPRTSEGPQPNADERAGSVSSTELSSAVDLIREASEAIRISEQRAEDLEAQLDHFATEAAEAMRKLNAELEAVEQKLSRTEENLRIAEGRANQAEAWLAKLYGAVHSAFIPLQGRQASQKLSDKSQETT